MVACGLIQSDLRDLARRRSGIRLRRGAHARTDEEASWLARNRNFGSLAHPTLRPWRPFTPIAGAATIAASTRTTTSTVTSPPIGSKYGPIAWLTVTRCGTPSSPRTATSWWASRTPSRRRPHLGRVARQPARRRRPQAHRHRLALAGAVRAGRDSATGQYRPASVGQPGEPRRPGVLPGSWRAGGGQPAQHGARWSARPTARLADRAAVRLAGSQRSAAAAVNRRRASPVPQRTSCGSPTGSRRAGYTSRRMISR